MASPLTWRSLDSALLLYLRANNFTALQVKAFWDRYAPWRRISVAILEARLDALGCRRDVQTARLIAEDCIKALLQEERGMTVEEGMMMVGEIVDRVWPAVSMPFLNWATTATPDKNMSEDTEDTIRVAQVMPFEEKTTDLTSLEDETELSSTNERPNQLEEKASAAAAEGGIVTSDEELRAEAVGHATPIREEAQGTVPRQINVEPADVFIPGLTMVRPFHQDSPAHAEPWSSEHLTTSNATARTSSPQEAQKDRDSPSGTGMLDVTGTDQETSYIPSPYERERVNRFLQLPSTFRGLTLAEWDMFYQHATFVINSGLTGLHSRFRHKWTSLLDDAAVTQRGGSRVVQYFQPFPRGYLDFEERAYIVEEVEAVIDLAQSQGKPTTASPSFISHQQKVTLLNDLRAFLSRTNPRYGCVGQAQPRRVFLIHDLRMYLDRVHVARDEQSSSSVAPRFAPTDGNANWNSSSGAEFGGKGSSSRASSESQADSSATADTDTDTDTDTSDLASSADSPESQHESEALSSDSPTSDINDSTSSEEPAEERSELMAIAPLVPQSSPALPSSPIAEEIPGQGAWPSLETPQDNWQTFITRAQHRPHRGPSAASLVYAEGQSLGVSLRPAYPPFRTDAGRLVHQTGPTSPQGSFNRPSLPRKRVWTQYLEVDERAQRLLLLSTFMVRRNGNWVYVQKQRPWAWAQRQQHDHRAHLGTHQRHRTEQANQQHQLQGQSQPLLASVPMSTFSHAHLAPIETRPFQPPPQAAPIAHMYGERQSEPYPGIRVLPHMQTHYHTNPGVHAHATNISQLPAGMLHARQLPRTTSVPLAPEASQRYPQTAAERRISLEQHTRRLAEMRSRGYNPPARGTSAWPWPAYTTSNARTSPGQPGIHSAGARPRQTTIYVQEIKPTHLTLKRSAVGNPLDPRATKVPRWTISPVRPPQARNEAPHPSWDATREIVEIE